MNTRRNPGADAAPDRHTDSRHDIGLNAYEIWRRRVLSPRLTELHNQSSWHDARAGRPPPAGKRQP